MSVREKHHDPTLNAEYTFQHGKELFQRLLERSHLEMLPPALPDRSQLGIVITPWVNTPVPWFSITLGLLARKKGWPVLYVWNDMPVALNNNMASLENKMIGEILAKIPECKVIRISQMPAIKLDEDDEEQMKHLGNLNAIWHTRTSISSPESNRLGNDHYQIFRDKLPKIKGLFSSFRFGSLIVPGGIFGDSGLFIWAGKKSGVRTATYDSGNGRLMTSVDNVAAHLHDIAKAFTVLDSKLTISQRELAITIAKSNLAQRFKGSDFRHFQVQPFDADSNTKPIDILMPLNIECDTAGLGQHRFFRSTSEWVIETVDFVLSRTRASIAVRFHPGERWRDQLYRNNALENELAHRFGSHPRFQCYPCVAQVNTYQILMGATVVLPCSSTVGLEAAAVGKHVVVESRCYYSDMPFVQRAECKADYFHKIQAAFQANNHISREITDAAWLFYFIVTCAHPIFVDFTAQPGDFMKWVQNSLQELSEDMHIQTVIKVLSEGTPATLFQFDRVLSDTDVTTSELETTGLPMESVRSTTVDDIVQSAFVNHKNVRPKEGADSYQNVSSVKSAHPSNLHLHSIVELDRINAKMRDQDIMPDVSIHRAIEFLNSGKSVEALEIFDKIKEQEPIDANVEYGRAVAFARMNRIEESIATLELLLSAAPSHAKGQRLLVELKLLIKNTAKHTDSTVVQKTLNDKRDELLNELDKFYPEVSFGKSVQILGLKNVTIKRGTCIGDDVWLNICIRDDKVRMTIGEKVLIGRRSMISTGGYLDIGDFCVFGPQVFIADADHVFQDILIPIIEQGATINRSVTIEENCWIGINAVVVGSLTVGRGSVIAANSVVTENVLPFSIVAGNPAKTIKMYNPFTKNWDLVRDSSEMKNITAIRAEIGIPSRKELKHILHANSRANFLDPILAGGGIHL